MYSYSATTGWGPDQRLEPRALRGRRSNNLPLLKHNGEYRGDSTSKNTDTYENRLGILENQNKDKNGPLYRAHNK